MSRTGRSLQFLANNQEAHTPTVFFVLEYWPWICICMCVFIKLMEEVHRQAICCDLTSPLSLAKPLLFTRPQPSLPLSKQTCMSDNVRNLTFPYLSEVKKTNIWSEPYFFTFQSLCSNIHSLFTLFSQLWKDKRETKFHIFIYS